MILDVMLPGRNGLDVLRELRTRGRRAPVLLLTARAAVSDKVAGLDLIRFFRSEQRRRRNLCKRSNSPALAGWPGVFQSTAIALMALAAVCWSGAATPIKSPS